MVNAVTGQALSVVSDVKGTTTDPVYKAMELLPLGPVMIVDTAGIDDEGELGQLRVEKSLAVLAKTDIAVLVVDGTVGLQDADRALLAEFEKRKLPYLIVYNKSDLKKMDGISISAKNKDISSLTEYLNELYKDDISLADEDILNNERQIALMKMCLNELEEVETHIDTDTTDVLVTGLDAAYHYLCQILGKEYQEDLIDHMFRNFCLGK